MAATELIHDPDASMFHLVEDGARIAHIEYVRTGDVYDLQHTVVEPNLRRRGVGAEIVEGVLARLRAEGARFIPTCPYIRHWMETHHDYDDLVAG